MVELDACLKKILDDNGPLQYYRVQFGLAKLIPGVDNVRYDVNISPGLRNTTTQLVYWLINSEVKSLGGHSKERKIPRMDKEWNDFQKGFSEVLINAVNKAKQAREPQIVSLAQAAVTKMCRDIIQAQFMDLVKKYQEQIRRYEVSRSHDLTYIFQVKEDLALMNQNRVNIASNVARDLMRSILEAWEMGIQESHIANFGRDTSVPREFFHNPVLFVNGAIDDFFMLREYVLLGHRMDDPLRYDALLKMIKAFLAKVLSPQQMSAQVATADQFTRSQSEKAAGDNESDIIDERDLALESILCCVENIDLLFNYFVSLERWGKKKKQKAYREEAERLERVALAQKQLLEGFYEHCRKTGLMDPIMAYYGMQPVLFNYCPPLLPHDVLNFFVNKGERKKVLDKLKRLRSLSGQQVPLKPLFKAAKTYRRVKKVKKLEYLITFFKAFVVYHRDYRNFKTIQENLHWVNLLDDEKNINLSRVNHTLYEFLRSNEQAPESRPIRDHVVLKADVRGSTEITSQLSEKRLNPASYFSLNFFDPINALLPEYGADKVFIEGDALILSIVEKEDAPEGWYAVARACGLAIRILRIVRQYNEKSRHHQLPVLEQGIGICFQDAPPTYLFDSDNRIMISWAINHADRLSSCHRGLRRHLENKTDFLNLFVFISSIKGAIEDARYIRYNVNGIELDGAAFNKLSQEIDLKQLQLVIPEIGKGKITLYTGTFPTQSEKYQRIIVREALMPIIHPETFKLEGMSTEKYYEVCNSSLIYDYVKKLV